MSEKYARQIRRENRRLINRAIDIVETDINHQIKCMSFYNRLKLGINIVILKKFCDFEKNIENF